MAWLVVLTGVCGTGKTSVGRALSEEENAIFIDADDFHSDEAISKMRQGQPLSDEDREPWLYALSEVLHQIARQKTIRNGRIKCVLACSGLKRSYRDQLTGRGRRERDISDSIVMVQLTAPIEVLELRMKIRIGHFMPSSLISSQLDILEPLSMEGEWPCLTCSAVDSVSSIVNTVQKFISSIH